MKIFYFSNKLSIFSKYFEVSDVIEPRTAMNSLVYWTDIQWVMEIKKGHLLSRMSPCAGYGSLPKKTKREFKLFPFFPKASKYLRKLSDWKQFSRFGKFTVVFGMICTSRVPRTCIPHCKGNTRRHKFPFAKMYLWCTRTQIFATLQIANLLVQK